MKKLLGKICSFVARKIHIHEQVLRFVIVGCFNTAFAYFLYAFLVFIGLHYSLAVLGSTVIGIFVSFKTMGALVFDNTKNSLIFRFLIVYGVGYLLNVLFIKWLLAVGVSNLYICGLISSLGVATINFFLNKYLVFKK